MKTTVNTLLISACAAVMLASCGGASKEEKADEAAQDSAKVEATAPVHDYKAIYDRLPAYTDADLDAMVDYTIEFNKYLVTHFSDTMTTKEWGQLYEEARRQFVYFGDFDSIVNLNIHEKVTPAQVNKLKQSGAEIIEVTQKLRNS